MSDITLEFVIKKIGGIITDDTKIFIQGRGPSGDFQNLAIGAWFDDAVLEYADAPIGSFTYFTGLNHLNIQLLNRH